VIELATGVTDCAVVDASGDVPRAPRRVLATALKQIAATQRAEAERRARQAARRMGGSTSA
jgi:hypothetical protein